MSLRFSRLLALCAAGSLVQATPIERAANPTVTISNGVVVGTATGVLNQPTVTGLVNAYLGVPFAQSPPLRFGPPTAASNWTSPLIAQTLPPACLQMFPTGDIGARTRQVFNNPFGPQPPESEDCLYLNVYSPQDASPTNLKPVLFWIFGGNLIFGTGSLNIYNGSSLAVNEDVVVVTINYRTNIFGFSNSPQIPRNQQNSGFLDQRFALQWVQQNIAAFGGDPNQVTIFGESAGGYSVKQILAQPPFPLPFRAAIMESQEVAFVGSGLLNYNQVLAHFGCLLVLDPLACIRQVKGTDIQAYISAMELNFPAVDDATHMSSVLPSILSGEFADVPVLIGTNKDEATAFIYAAGFDPATANFTSVLTPLGFNFSNTSVPLSSPFPTLANGSFEVANRIGTDLAFTCTTQTLSSAIQGRQPVWRYRYDGVFPGTTIYPLAGSYHTSEIPQVFGTYPLTSRYGTATADQAALSAYMQGIWAGFAKGQDPNWPKLGSNGGVELSLLGSQQNTTGNVVVPLITADYPCVVYDPILILSGKAY